MHKNENKTRLLSYTGIALTLLLSFLLMFHTFSYDPIRSQLQISSKLWSDFGAHIPLIRSFSKGPNLTRLVHLEPVESPLFPGEPVRYHFGFYALVGLLEKLGVRLDWALNSLSAFGLFALVLGIYHVSFALFKRRSVSLLSVVFFLFNGSLAFVPFFRNHPLSLTTPIDIITNSKFPAFGPWDNGYITAFWNLNIYTNQRHLGLSYALLLGIILMLYLPAKNHFRTGVFVATLTGLLLFLHFATAGIAAIFLTWMFVSQKKLRIPLLMTIGSGILVFSFLQQVSTISSGITLKPGYLIPDGTLTVPTFIRFWIENIGLHLLFIPVGIMLSPRPVRTFIGPPLVLLFIIANIYKFSPDMINNHKFFNFFLILGNMFSSYALIRILDAGNRITHAYTRTVVKGLVAVCCISVFILSGIIDLFPVLNDSKGEVPDIAANPDSQFIDMYTDPADRIANSTWFYHPASIAGRSLFSGYTYFTWSYGYAQSQREVQLLRIYSATGIVELCQTLRQNDISWIELNTAPESYIKPNWDLWKRLPFAYQNPQTMLTIYKSDQICAHESY